MKGILLLALAAPSVARAEPGFTVHPAPPAWVEVLDLPEGEGMLLVDDQVRVEGVEVVHFRRRATRLDTVAAVHDGSELSFEIDPTYERLVLHHVRLVRDGVSIDALDPADLKVLQQESDLSRRIYNGTQSVLAFLRDVRVGDVVDYAWTVEGANPALDGHYADGFALGWTTPVARRHVRLLWPSGRDLHLRPHRGAPEPTVRTVAGHTEHRWDLRAPSVQVDPDAPSWSDPYPWVQASEFSSWEDVVRWALPHYEIPEPGPDLRALIDRLEREHETPAARAEAALAFVEDEVRYLGIEIGPRGLIPHHPDETLARRFGDCKDKAMLLVAILQAMGIDARPALVHTDRRHAVRDLHPTAYAFDHVIVRLRLDGRTLWLDATRSHERGPLEARLPPAVGVALVLEPGTRALEPVVLPSLDEPTAEVHERWELHDLAGPAVLVATGTHRGLAAAFERRGFERNTHEEVSDSYRRFYQQDFDEVRVLEPIRTTDEADRFTVVERYEVDGFWKDGGRRLDAWHLVEAIPVPPAGDRTQPLAWQHPVHLRHVTEVRLPVDFLLEEGTTEVRSEAFTYRRTTRYDDDVLTVTHELQSHRDHVAAEDLAEHRAAVEEARRKLVYWLPRDAVDPGMSPEMRGTLIGGVLVLGFLGGGSALGWSRRRWDRIRLRRRLSSGGRSPEAPLRVESSAQALEALGLERCDCGGELALGRREGADLTFGGRAVLRVDVPCVACDATTTRFFVFRD